MGFADRLKKGLSRSREALNEIFYFGGYFYSCNQILIVAVMDRDNPYCTRGLAF